MLDAKVILNNFFGSPKCSMEMGSEINKETIEKCSVFLSNNLPGYVVCDLSDESIHEAVEDGDFDYDFMKENFTLRHRINRDIYNNYYPKIVADKIEEITDCFFEFKLYEENITPVKTLVS